MYYIYEITNDYPDNGKTYIGQHKYSPTETPETDKYMGSGKLIRAAIKKYGIDYFSKKILIAGIETKEEIDKLEKLYIDEARKNGKAEYNIADGGGGVEGYHFSPESKRRMSETTTAYFSVPENRKKQSEISSDYWSDPEYRQKQVDSQTARWSDPENRQKQSETITAYFAAPENRQKTSEATKVAMADPETRQKHLEGMKALLEDEERSDEWRRKLSEAHQGKPAWNKGKKGRIWITDGVSSSQVPKDTPIPEGWWRGRKL